MKNQAILKPLLSFCLVLLAWIQWIGLTSKNSYLQEVFPFLSVSETYYISIALLIGSLVALIGNSYLTNLGEFVSYQLMDKCPAIVQLGYKAVVQIKSFILIIFMGIAFIIFIKVPLQAKREDTYHFISFTYLVSLIGIFIYKLKALQPIENFEGIEVPPTTKVIDLSGRLGYIYKRVGNEGSWHLKTGVMVLIGDKAMLFHITKNLRRFLDITIKNPVFNGIMRITLDPVPTHFPEVLTDPELTRLKYYADNTEEADDKEKLELFLEKAIDSRANQLLATVKQAFQVSANSASIEEDAVEQVINAFSLVISELESVDADIFIHSVQNNINQDIFQKPVNFHLFKVTANLKDFGYTERFEQIRQNLVEITNKLVSARFDSQVRFKEMIASLAPVMVSYSTDSLDNVVASLRDLYFNISSSKSIVSSKSIDYASFSTEPQITAAVGRLENVRKKLIQIGKTYPSPPEGEKLRFFHRALRDESFIDNTDVYYEKSFREYLRERLPEPYLAILNPDSDLYSVNAKTVVKSLLLQPANEKL